MLCWYTELGSSSTLREYGCIQNSTIVNDLTDNPLHIQTSKRCQVRWSLFLSSTVFDYNNPTVRDITSSTPIYSETGSIGFVTFSRTNQELVGNFYKVPSAETMTPSSTGYLYILPIANINNGNIVSIKTNHVGSCIVSETEPLYKNYKLWYNPSTKNTKLYLNGIWIGLNETDIIASTTAPTGILKSGTLWYNTTTGSIRVYISSSWILLNDTQVFKVATKPAGSYRDGTLWYNTTMKSFSVYTATTGGFTEIMQALTETDLNSILVL